MGIFWALLSGYLGWSWFTKMWISPFGTIFINALKMIAVPLVLFSVISGIASLKDATSLGRLGFKTLGLYLITTLFSVSLGLLVVNVFAPGNSENEERNILNRIKYELWAEQANVEIADGKSILHDEKYAQYINEAQSNLSAEMANDDVQNKIASAKSAKNAGPLQFLVDMVPSNIFYSFTSASMLQIIFFGIFFGIAMISLPEEKTRIVFGFIHGANDVFIRMVDIIMNAAPYFVFALMAGTLAEMAGDNPASMLGIFKALGAYSLVVVFGLAIMLFVIYPGLVTLVRGKRDGVSKAKVYKWFNKGIRPAQLLAFSTSSSAATLPVTMECVHDNLGVEEEVSSFVLPIGATVNMDGTSLYQAVAVVFLAQFHWIDLSLAQQFTIVLTATLASIGSAAIPSAGLIMLIIVLESVGLNPAWIAIIFPVDRLLDMCRTVVNVTGDATVSTIVAQTEGKLRTFNDDLEK